MKNGESNADIIIKRSLRIYLFLVKIKRADLEGETLRLLEQR